MKKTVEDAYSEILRLRNEFYQQWQENDEPSDHNRIILKAKYEAFDKALELLTPSIVDPQPKDSGELTHSVTKISDQEDPVKKASAEEAAIKSLPNSPYSVQVDNLGGYIPAWDQEQMFDMFKNGVKWKEQQMMKGAVGGYVDQVEYPGSTWIELSDTPKDLKDGDKVKLVIIKEDILNNKEHRAEVTSKVISKCIYAKDEYSRDDRIILCNGCEEECEYNLKEENISEVYPPTLEGGYGAKRRRNSN